jgi:hypothetical protein
MANNYDQNILFNLILPQPIEQLKNSVLDTLTLY